MHKFHICSSDMATTYHLHPCMPGVLHTQVFCLSTPILASFLFCAHAHDAGNVLEFFRACCTKDTTFVYIYLWLSPSSLPRIMQLSSNGCQSLELVGSEAMVSYARTLVWKSSPSYIYWRTSSTSFRGWLQRSLFGLAFGDSAGTLAVCFLIDLNAKLTTGWQF